MLFLISKTFFIVFSLLFCIHFFSNYQVTKKKLRLNRTCLVKFFQSAYRLPTMLRKPEAAERDLRPGGCLRRVVNSRGTSCSAPVGVRGSKYCRRRRCRRRRAPQRTSKRYCHQRQPPSRRTPRRRRRRRRNSVHGRPIDTTTRLFVFNENTQLPLTGVIDVNCPVKAHRDTMFLHI